MLFRNYKSEKINRENKRLEAELRVLENLKNTIQKDHIKK